MKTLVAICILSLAVGQSACQDYVDLTHPAGNGITYSWPWFEPFRLIVKYDTFLLPIISESPPHGGEQGCKMVYFHTKPPNFDIFSYQTPKF
jgi:hypothetical protein